MFGRPFLKGLVLILVGKVFLFFCCRAVGRFLFRRRPFESGPIFTFYQYFFISNYNELVRMSGKEVKF